MGTLLLAAVVVACAPPQPEPRSVLDFMEDGLARDGALTRCNEDRDATLTDVECANARRAAATLAIELERAGAPGLELESERKLLALRERSERETAVERDATTTARAAAEAAYEAQWRDPVGQRDTSRAANASNGAPAFGVPMGPVMPSMTESALFDVYAEATDPLGRRSLEIAAAEPPANDLQIFSPEVEIADLAIIPRPFRSDDGPAVPQ